MRNGRGPRSQPEEAEVAEAPAPAPVEEAEPEPEPEPVREPDPPLRAAPAGRPKPSLSLDTQASGAPARPRPPVAPKSMTTPPMPAQSQRPPSPQSQGAPPPAAPRVQMRPMSAPPSTPAPDLPGQSPPSFPSPASPTGFGVPVGGCTRRLFNNPFPASRQGPRRHSRQRGLRRGLSHCRVDPAKPPSRSPIRGFRRREAQFLRRPRTFRPRRDPAARQTRWRRSEAPAGAASGDGPPL